MQDSKYTVKQMTAQVAAHQKTCLCNLCMANHRAKKAGLNRKKRRAMQKRARKAARKALKK